MSLPTTCDATTQVCNQEMPSLTMVGGSYRFEPFSVFYDWPAPNFSSYAIDRHPDHTIYIKIYAFNIHKNICIQTLTYTQTRASTNYDTHATWPRIRCILRPYYPQSWREPGLTCAWCNNNRVRGLVFVICKFKGRYVWGLRLWLVFRITFESTYTFLAGWLPHSVCADIAQVADRRSRRAFAMVRGYG